MLQRKFVLAVAVLLIVCASTLAPLPAVEDPRPDLLNEDAWFAVYLQGAHVGWMHAERRPVIEEERQVAYSRTELFFRIQRYGREMEVGSTIEAWEEIGSGKPLRFHSESQLSQMKTRMEGRFEDGKLHLETNLMGNTTTSSLDWPEDGALFYGGDLGLIRATNLTPGKQFSYVSYSPDLGTVVHQTVRVGESRPDGLLQLVTTQKELPGQDTFSLVQRAGWKLQEIDIPSTQTRMVRTTKERAMELSSESPDIGFSTMVSVDLDVKKPRAVNRALYRIRAPGGILEHLELEEAGRQIVHERSSEEVRLEVKRRGFPEEREGGPAQEGKFLSPSSYLQIESEPMRNAFAQATSGKCKRSMEPQRLAQCLARWVQTNVDETALDVGFASAGEVASNRRGDCTEHAVFLAGLLRMAGIPSRVRAGLIYLPKSHDQGGLFGFHLWTQAWLGDWVDLDATLGGEEADALHLGLATSDLADPSGITPLAVMAPVMGRLELEVLEAE